MRLFFGKLVLLFSLCFWSKLLFTRHKARFSNAVSCVTHARNSSFTLGFFKITPYAVFQILYAFAKNLRIEWCIPLTSRFVNLGVSHYTFLSLCVQDFKIYMV